MHLSVHGKNIDIGDALRTHIETRLSEIFSKYFGDAIEASVTLTPEGPFYHARLLAQIGSGIDVAAEHRADRPYDAFDGAAEHLAKRLRRYKRRLRDHHRRNGADGEDGRQVVLATESEDSDDGESEAGPAGGQPPIVAEMPYEVPTLTVGEAVMHLDLGNHPAMMFRNAGHGGYNMVYRRGDGNIGWIDPQGNTAS